MQTRRCTAHMQEKSTKTTSNLPHKLMRCINEYILPKAELQQTADVITHFSNFNDSIIFESIMLDAYTQCPSIVASKSTFTMEMMRAFDLLNRFHHQHDAEDTASAQPIAFDSTSQSREIQSKSIHEG